MHHREDGQPRIRGAVSWVAAFAAMTSRGSEPIASSRRHSGAGRNPRHAV